MSHTPSSSSGSLNSIHTSTIDKIANQSFLNELKAALSEAACTKNIPELKILQQDLETLIRSTTQKDFTLLDHLFHERDSKFILQAKNRALILNKLFPVFYDKFPTKPKIYHTFIKTILLGTSDTDYHYQSIKKQKLDLYFKDISLIPSNKLLLIKHSTTSIKTTPSETKGIGHFNSHILTSDQVSFTNHRQSCELELLNQAKANLTEYHSLQTLQMKLFLTQYDVRMKTIQRHMDIIIPLYCKENGFDQLTFSSDIDTLLLGN
jgi:hypothetical protein